MNMKMVGSLHNTLCQGTRLRRQYCFRSASRFAGQLCTSSLGWWPSIVGRGASLSRRVQRFGKLQGSEASPTRGLRWVGPKICVKGLLLLLLVFMAFTGRAALQFDVFPGYDWVIPEASWFPVICEIKNDGPPFNGIIELTPSQSGGGQTRRAIVELPTGTLKRLTIPVFSTRGSASWDVRLLDERGKLRGEQTGLRARKQTGAGTLLVGALARTASGTPILEAIKSQQADLQPTSARMLPSIFPDNPLVLEGMDALYLNSERASDLKNNQVEALFAWVNAGGHLIVAVEQVGDITASEWLKSLFPAEVKEMRPLRSHFAFQKWLQEPWPGGSAAAGQARRSAGNRGITINDAESRRPFAGIPDDSKFELAEMQVVAAKVRQGQVLVTEDDLPLIVTANRGLGRVTALLFSPEREPFRSWKYLPIFWARLAEVPGANYVANNNSYYQGGFSSDGIFGALLDTKQVHKLPVEWLLVLLIVYLVVIGPLDQFWLKKIGRPMLTWITFPCYVVLFSLLIYFIGYKLRAGESEWNELHLVDVLINGDRAQLRGRTYASVYSPSNQRYLLEGQQKYSTLRGEFVGAWGANQSTERATIVQNGDSFKAEIFVPVWSSQLLVNDWWQPSSVPLNVTVTSQGENYLVTAENKTDRKLTDAKIVIDNQVMTIGELPAGQTRTVTVGKGQGTPLPDFVSAQGQSFQGVLQSRQRAFGASESGRLEDVPNSTIAASFLSQMQNRNEYMNNFISPPGLDLSSSIEHGEAILFAYVADYSPVKTMYKFTPKRTHRSTMFRFAIPVIKQS